MWFILAKVVREVSPNRATIQSNMIPESRELARPSLNFRTTCKFRTSKQMIQPEMPIVSCANRPSLRWLFTFVLVALAAAAVPAFAQEKKGEPSHSQGYVEDWSSHHVVFSNPGTEQDARKRGEYDKWLRIVNDERYMMQQRRRSSPRRWGGWGHDESSIQRDWSMLLGTSTAASATGTFTTANRTAHPV